MCLELVCLGNKMSLSRSTRQAHLLKTSIGIKSHITHIKPHVRIKVRSGYKAQDIRECIQAKLPRAKLKQLSAPLPKSGAKLVAELARQAKPTRPIQTNKTVTSRPVAAA
mgnify:CR=1 FL=1